MWTANWAQALALVHPVKKEYPEIMRLNLVRIVTIEQENSVKT